MLSDLGELTSGQLVVVTGGALVRKFQSEEEHYTVGLQAGMVITKHHQWNEVAPEERVVCAVYLVLFSNDNKLYLVGEQDLAHPDHARDPGRLFGRFSG